MVETRVFRHEHYELICSATAVDGGKYAPALVVSRQVWPTRPRVIAVRRGSYETEETAITAAFNQGVEWIRDYG